ncbi:hypothetical protein EU537_05945 [Candidatus Thorarchaeota archaeon]|nr:MAG: hypothetical protein EU537_05945 [Candidatus Thorarchaeota archaeon]
MESSFSSPLNNPLYPPPPYHYENARLSLSLFYPSEGSVQSLLPTPLKPSQLPLMALLVAEQPCKETGTFMEAGVLVQCMFDNPDSGQEDVGVYFAQNFVDSDIALAAGREIWGYPRKLANISLDLKGDILSTKVIRNGTLLIETTCELSDEGEWIDSGPNINAKVIPKTDGTGHSISSLTAAYLTYDIKNGRSGDVEINIHGTPENGLDAIEIESSMIGLYFECDMIVPAAKEIANLEL